MDIFNQVGEFLEADVSIVKIDVVLSVEFAQTVAQDDDVNIVKTLSHQYGVPIHRHDLMRVPKILRLYKLFTTSESYNESVDYFQDSLMVVFEWITKFRVLYGTRNRHAAFMEFREIVNLYRVRSVLSMAENDLQAMFYYLYNRCLLTPIHPKAYSC